MSFDKFAMGEESATPRFVEGRFSKRAAACEDCGLRWSELPQGSWMMDEPYLNPLCRECAHERARRRGYSPRDGSRVPVEA